MGRTEDDVREEIETEVVEEAGVPAVAETGGLMTVAQGLQRIDRRMEVMDSLRRRALGGLTSRGWNRWPGRKYRLTLDGAQYVARQCAISHTAVVQSSVMDPQGQPVGIMLQAHFYLPGGYDRVLAIGTCEYSDGFVWSAKKRTVRHADGYKKAYANLVVNGVEGLLGIGIVDDDAIRELGMDPAKIEDIDVESGKRGESREIPDELKPQYQEAAKLLGEIAGGDGNLASVILLELTAWPEKDFKGWDRIAKVSAKAIGPTLGKLRKRHAEVCGGKDREAALDQAQGPDGKKRKAAPAKKSPEGESLDPESQKFLDELDLPFGEQKP